MEDLFAKEQQTLDAAVSFLEKLRDGAPWEIEQYALIVREYGKLLKQTRRITKISDRTTKTLNTRKMDLQSKVNYDVMTGLYSRRFLEDNLVRMIETLPSSQCLGVLMMDIDFFKRYNDTYGHSMGDECLREVAAVLLESVKGPGSFVARYGGEEFIAILPGVGESGIAAVADDILRTIRSRRIPHEGNDAVGFVTISIGGTCGLADGIKGGDAFVQQADRALYRSKQTGRNKYTFLALEAGDDVSEYS